MSVWQGRPFSGGNNRVERGTVRAQPPHAVLDLGSQIHFGHRGLEMPQRLVKRRRIQPDGIPDGGDFVGRFHHAQRFDRAADRLEPDPRKRLRKRLMFFKTDPITFKSDRLEAEPLDGDCNLTRKRPLRDPYLTIRFPCGLRAIARVGEYNRPFAGKEKRGVAAGKTTQISDVGKRRSEECAGSHGPESGQQFLAPKRKSSYIFQVSLLWLQQQFAGRLTTFEIAVRLTGIG